MRSVLRCGQGHEWEPPADVFASGIGQFCPVCGELEQTRAGPPLPNTSPPLFQAALPASVLTRYDVLEEVGQGGMGVVFRARHRLDGSVVAIKVIRKDRLDSPESRSRFSREVMAARRLSHPNIVLLLDADEHGDPPYLVMEYVAGPTLQRLVDEAGPLPVSEALDALRQTALALQHAHEQGLVHRDIKPGNLMRLEVGTRRQIKVLDMGVVRLVHPRLDTPLLTLTQPGSVIGTPDYIAPEQLEDSHTADIRSDLYSLGCTAYFLLTRSVPFPGGTLYQKLNRHRQEVPASVEQLRPEVPRSVAAVVRRLMAKEPSQRYQTPLELVDALDELAAGGEVAVNFRAAALAAPKTWPAHSDGVHCLAWLPDGRLLSGGRDQTVRLWGPTGEPLWRAEQSRPVLALAVLPGATRALLATGVTLRLFEVDTGKELARWAGHTDAVRSLVLSPDGRLAASGSDDRMARVWDMQTGRTLDRLRHATAVNGVAFDGEGLRLAAAGRDQQLLLWDVPQARVARSFAVPRGAVLSVAFRPRHRHLVSAHYDTTIRLWEADSGRERRRFQGHKQMVAAVACSPDGRLIASAGHDRTVRLWEPESGVERNCGERHSGAVEALAFSPDGRILASGAADGAICLWDLSG